jgi:hypothetical protein
MPKKNTGSKGIERIVQKARQAHTKMLTQITTAEQRVRQLGDMLDRIEASITRAGSAASRPVRPVAGSAGGPAKRAAAKRSTAKRGTAKRAAGTRSTAKRGTRRAPAKRSTGSRPTAKRAPAKRSTTARRRRPGTSAATS